MINVVFNKLLLVFSSAVLWTILSISCSESGYNSVNRESEKSIRKTDSIIRFEPPNSREATIYQDRSENELSVLEIITDQVSTVQLIQFQDNIEMVKYRSRELHIKQITCTRESIQIKKSDLVKIKPKIDFKDYFVSGFYLHHTSDKSISIISRLCLPDSDDCISFKIIYDIKTCTAEIISDE